MIGMTKYHTNKIILILDFSSAGVQGNVKIAFFLTIIQFNIYKSRVYLEFE